MISMATGALVSHSLTVRALYKVDIYVMQSGVNLFLHSNSTYLSKHIVRSKLGHLGTLYLHQNQASCHSKMHIISFAE